MRNSPRFSNALPIEYRQLDNPQIRLGYTSDISEGGLMFSPAEQMAVGERLRLKIYFISGPNSKAVDDLEVTGKVVWSKTDESKAGNYQTGVEFVDISAEGAESLRSFLTHFGDRY